MGGRCRVRQAHGNGIKVYGTLAATEPVGTGLSKVVLRWSLSHVVTGRCGVGVRLIPDDNGDKESSRVEGYLRGLGGDEGGGKAAIACSFARCCCLVLTYDAYNNGTGASNTQGCESQKRSATNSACEDVTADR